MPRYRQAHAFQLGDYWLSQRRGSPAWCRTWFDASTRQTKRVSLGTTDLPEAKECLTEWFVAENRPQQAPASDFTIAQALLSYWVDHAQHLSSHGTAQIYSRYWLDYFGETVVGDLTGMKIQTNFRAWLQKKGMKASSINRVLVVGRAAFNRAYRNGEIDAAPHIAMIEEGEAPPLGRPLEFSEMVRLIEQVNSDHMLAFCLLMMGTSARPDAVRELTREQIDFENGLIRLNPPGRPQTKKYRPTVKLPNTLYDYLYRAPPGPLIAFRGKKVAQVRTAVTGRSGPRG